MFRILEWLKRKRALKAEREQVSPDDVLYAEERLATKIGDLEHDYATVNQWRQQNRNDTLKLQRAIKRVAERDYSSTEKRTLTDLRKYERLLRRQVEDLEQIMRLLRNLIQTEYHDILYDIQRPLAAFEHFFGNFKEGVASSQQGLSEETIENARAILGRIDTAYQDIVKHTLAFLEGDFAYYTNIGLNFHGFEEKHDTDVPLVVHLRNRGRLKQQMNGKTQYIVSQLNMLKQQLKDTPLNQTFSGIIELLEHQFTDLSNFCMKRVDLSNAIIIEAIIFQKDMNNALTQTLLEVQGFTEQLQAEQRRISEEKAPHWKSKQMARRLEIFEQARTDITETVEKLRKDLSTELEHVREEDASLLYEETTQARNEERQIASFGRRFTVAATSAAAALAILVVAHHYVSQYGNVTSPKAQQTSQHVQEQHAPASAAQSSHTADEHAGDRADRRAEAKPATQETADVSQHPVGNVIRIGSATVRIETHGHGGGIVYFNMHDDEDTSAAAARRAVDRYGGGLIELKHTGKRLITFSLGSSSYIFDPNRIFTDKGIKDSLQKYGPYSKEAHAAVQKFAEQLLSHPLLRDAKIVVAMHNNTEGRYSAETYLREMRKDAADVNIVPGTDSDDFFFVTGEHLYRYIQRNGYNAVLQSNEPEDDGSFSIYASEHNILYVNVEAQHGHGKEQDTMISVLQGGLTSHDAVVQFSEQKITDSDIARVSPLVPNVYQTRRDADKYHLIIDGEQQSVFLIHNREIVGKFPTSTAKSGFGEKQDSWKTPRGLLRVREVIGRNMPRGTEFIGRQPVRTGGNTTVRTIHTDAYDSKEDAILSRIVWLEGAERFNKNTLGRHIYLHGTNEEGLLGRPVSHGCPRLSNDAVIRLADEYLAEGSNVYVVEGSPAAAPTRIAHASTQGASPYVRSFISTLYQEPEDASRYHVLVDGPKQQVHIVHDRQIVETLSTSTGKYGWGRSLRSGRTPEGLHKVTQIVGEGEPIGTVISGGSIVREHGEKKVVSVHDTKDKPVMTTRVIYIHGLESGNSNSLTRGIRIHGTNKEEKLGNPDSGGCIRVANTEVIRLADSLLVEGSKVFIIGETKLANLDHESTRDELLGK